MSVTLRDIAKACAVDVSTVSRALRDDERVRPETRQRVAEVAQRLGYRANLLARQLVTGQTRTVWFLLGSITGMQDHLPSQAASRYCLGRGYDLHVVLHHNDPAACDRVFSRLQQHLADGAIMVAGDQLFASPKLIELVDNNVPLVFLDRHVPDIAVPVFTSDNRAAVIELMARCSDAGATHAISQFHRPNTVEHERQAGFVAGCARFGLQPWSPEEGPLPAGACLAVLASRGWQIQDCISRHREQIQGHELCFACFDEWFGEPHPAKVVFTAKQDFTAMAEAASEALLAMIAGEERDREAVHRVPALAFEEFRPRF
jgi:DNA-binding LacI/PurR family transcriptional regulator